MLLMVNVVVKKWPVALVSAQVSIKFVEEKVVGVPDKWEIELMVESLVIRLPFILLVSLDSGSPDHHSLACMLVPVALLLVLLRRLRGMMSTWEPPIMFL